MSWHCFRLFSSLALLALAPGLTVAGTAPVSSAGAPAAHGCLPSGNGYLHARIRGALTLDLEFAGSAGLAVRGPQKCVQLLRECLLVFLGPVLRELGWGGSA